MWLYDKIPLVDAPEQFFSDDAVEIGIFEKHSLDMEFFFGDA
jgi:hypothetical protein